MQTHQDASHDSHFRLWPGGGGVSENRMPLGSVRVPSEKNGLPPLEAFGRRWRSVCTDTRDSDIAGSPAARALQAATAAGQPWAIKQARPTSACQGCSGASLCP